jgi:hypothetical protein
MLLNRMPRLSMEREVHMQACTLTACLDLFVCTGAGVLKAKAEAKEKAKRAPKSKVVHDKK